jgi:2-oxoisovalerate dehydrogenase E1 component
LTVVMPSSPADLYGLLRSAIDDPNPVVVVENRLLYDRIGPAPAPGLRLPIGKAHVVRPGTDVTVVAVSRMVHVALEAAAAMAAEGAQAEVIDLRTVVPLDFATIAGSVERTGRLVIVHEAVTDFGIGAEIAARAADEGFWNLDSPIRRVGAGATPPPYAPGLEAAWLPDAGSVVEALREVLNP